MELSIEKKNEKSDNRGYALIELLTLIAIIGLLASIVVASFSIARQKAKIVQAKADINVIRTAIAFMAHDANAWPGHQRIGVVQSGVSGNEIEDLNSGFAGLAQTDGTYIKWNGPYIKSVPNDPWGHPYFLDTDYDIDPTATVKNAAVIGSYGPNGTGLNLYDSDDIYMTLLTQ